MVFVGQVEKIEPRGGVVEVTFTVQQPVLGVVGGSYVMREWAGLWTGGQEPFRVGERAMFFLHAPRGAAGGEAGGVGLSSPVDGMMGVVPVVPMGASGGALLDVRWLEARVRRTPGTPLAGASTGAIALADAVAVTRGWQTDAVAEPRRVRLPDGVLASPREGTQGQDAAPQGKEAGDAQR